MKTKRFRVTFTVAVELDISEELIAEVLKPDWQSTFYKLERPEDVAFHLAYNVASNHTELKFIDGFADRDEGDMKIVSEDWADEEAEEVK